MTMNIAFTPLRTADSAAVYPGVLVSKRGGCFASFAARLDPFRCRTRHARKTSVIIPGLRFLPARQLWNPARKNSGEKAGHSEVDNLLPHSRLHLSHGDIWQNKLSVLITMTAIHAAPRSVTVGATAFFI